VAGHSLWFKNFFLAFLPHPLGAGDIIQAAYATSQKMANGGAVSLELVCVKPKGIYLSKQQTYFVLPQSVVPLYKGFETGDKDRKGNKIFSKRAAKKAN